MSAIEKLEFNSILLLCNYSKAESTKYLRWIKPKTDTKVTLHQATLPDQTNFIDIHREVTRVVDDVPTRTGPENTTLTFHLSAGTPAMRAVFVLLSKTGYPANLIQTSQEKGLGYVSLVFDL